MPLIRSTLRTPIPTSGGVKSASGVLFVITRLMSSQSTLSLASGSHNNLSLVNGNRINANAPIALGATQTAIVREVLGQVAVEYPIVFTGAYVAPAQQYVASGYVASGYIGNS